MPAITKESILEAAQDLSDLKTVVTAGPTVNVTTRLGQVVPSLAKAMSEIQAQAYVILDDPAALRAYVKPPEVGAVILVNIGTGADLLGGVYWYDSSSTATDDGVNVIDPAAAGSGRWLRLSPVRGALPAMFGAAGDGETSDISAFTALEEVYTGLAIDLEGRTHQVGTTPPSGNYYYNGYWVPSTLDNDDYNGDNFFPAVRPVRAAIWSTDYSDTVNIKSTSKVTRLKDNLLFCTQSSTSVAVRGSNNGFIVLGNDSGAVSYMGNSNLVLRLDPVDVIRNRGKQVTLQWDMPTTVYNTIAFTGFRGVWEFRYSLFPSSPVTAAGKYAMHDALVSTWDARMLVVSSASVPRDPRYPYWKTVTIPADASSACFVLKSYSGTGAVSSIPYANVYVSEGYGPADIVPRNRAATENYREVLGYPISGTALLGTPMEELSSAVCKAFKDYSTPGTPVTVTPTSVGRGYFSKSSAGTAIHGAEIAEEKTI